jgi:serralysin
MPGFSNRGARTTLNDWGEMDGAIAHFRLTPALHARTTDAMMLTGHSLVPPQLPALILIPDNVPGDTGTTATLTVGAPSIVSTINSIGDQDYYSVTLEAGQTYEFGMYAKTGGPNLVPLTDAYLEIYDSLGNLIVSGDGGAATLLNNLNSGFDVLLTYTPDQAGTYYVNARAYDQDPTNGTTGDFVGDYELFVQEAAAGGYRPYYDEESPLYSIDWGTQVDGSSRNPDGEEGPRETGNPFTGHAWNPYGIEGKNVITYYFARAGEIFIDEDPTTPGTTDTIVAKGFEQWEMDAYLNAFGAYSNVADIVYVEVDDRTDADFVLITYLGTPGPGVSLLGRMSPPDEENEGRTEFNAADERWTEEGLAPGGFSFTTLIHELGHGHGLAHPHDNGGRSGIMRGVESEGAVADYTNGDFDLNQSIYTMMSYEDGWELSPYGQAETTDPFGWLGSLMAFDVAAIQDKYGVNEEYRTGDDIYVLKDVNAAGTYYSCIWDADGVDAITYSGGANANIDLRPASLLYEYGGGGWISYAFGIHGGFTIANGVTIENASGGTGNDTLTGNAVANLLSGGHGADAISAGDGDDTLLGGAGADALDGGDGIDTAVFSDFNAAVSVNLNIGQGFGNQAQGDTYSGIENVIGSARGDFIIGDSGTNRLDGAGGDDILVGSAGADLLVGAGGADIASYGDNWGAVFINLTLGQGFGNAAHGDTYDGIENLDGGIFDDFFIGDEGANVLAGRLGNDILVGAGGADTFLFDTAAFAANVDTIVDFASGTDRIALDDAAFAGLALGALAAGAFAIGTAAGDADDRILYDGATGALLFDADGSGDGAAVQFATLEGAPSLTAGDFAVI